MLIWMTLALIQSHWVCKAKGKTSLLHALVNQATNKHYSDNSSAILFKLGMTVDIDALYHHARLDDLGLDTRSQWVSKGKQISVACSWQTSKQAMFSRDLDVDFANVYRACPTCFFLQ